MILACQKLLGQITKVLGFWETPPPRMGKTPKKSRIFFLRGSLMIIMIVKIEIVKIMMKKMTKKNQLLWLLSKKWPILGTTTWWKKDQQIWLMFNWSTERSKLAFITALGPWCEYLKSQKHESSMKWTMNMKRAKRISF